MPNRPVAASPSSPRSFGSGPVPSIRPGSVARRGSSSSAGAGGIAASGATGGNSPAGGATGGNSPAGGGGGRRGWSRRCRRWNRGGGPGRCGRWSGRIRRRGIRCGGDGNRGQRRVKTAAETEERAVSEVGRDAPNGWSGAERDRETTAAALPRFGHRRGSARDRCDNRDSRSPRRDRSRQATCRRQGEASMDGCRREWTSGAAWGCGRPDR